MGSLHRDILRGPAKHLGRLTLRPVDGNMPYSRARFVTFRRYHRQKECCNGAPWPSIRVYKLMKLR